MSKLKPDLYWAVVEHIQTWLFTDGPFCRAIEQSQGDLDGVTVRRIAIAYNVSRGIRAKDGEGDKCANGLAQLLNKARPWPQNLSDRANMCLEIAQRAASLSYTKGIQVSAITKFSWFMQPDNWTPFDRLVARAMDVDHLPDRMLQFYHQLQCRGFLDLAQEIQTALDEEVANDWLGTRVLDKYMMLRGADETWARNLRSMCHGFVAALPSSWQQDVKRIASRVVSSVNAEHLRAFLPEVSRGPARSSG